jgi:hypothetical protein
VLEAEVNEVYEASSKEDVRGGFKRSEQNQERTISEYLS